MISSPGCDDLRGIEHARPAHLGDMKQAFDAGAEIDECAEVADRRHAAGNHSARHNGLAELDCLRPLLFFEERAPRDDEVLAAVPVLDDPELVDLPDMLRRIRAALRVDLRERAEAALAGDADLVSALDLPFDLAFDGKPGVEGVLELAQRRRTTRQRARERDPSGSRHDHRLDAIADVDLDVALVIFQFSDFDHRFALAANVDEGYVRSNRDDRAFDCLPLCKAPGLD